MRWLSHSIGWGLLRNLAGRPRPEIVSQVEASSFAGRNKVSLSRLSRCITGSDLFRNMELWRRGFDAKIRHSLVFDKKQVLGGSDR